MTFKDIFKQSFVETFVFNQINLGSAVLSIAVSLAIGVFIFYIYKKTYRGIVYSRSFNMSLILMCVITTVIITTITSNLVLSLGMVGALSIIRFRAAIKDPMDIMFLFWAISAGIVVGAQQYIYAAAASLIIGAICFIMFRKSDSPCIYLLVISYSKDVSSQVDAQLSELKSVLRNKSYTHGRIEMTVEIRSKEKGLAAVDNLSALEGVESAVLVNYDGDYAE